MDPVLQLFRDIRPWRASDKHTGIGRLAGGIVYTYRHIAPGDPGLRAEVYRVETVVPIVPAHNNVHFVPAYSLDDFIMDIGDPDCAEYLVDIRPVSEEEARQELKEFKTTHGK